MQALTDRVIVKRDAAEEVSAGGIALPKNEEQPTRGTVINVGPGIHIAGKGRTLMDVIEGDIVYFGKYSGSPVKIEGEDYVILRHEDLMAKE